MVAAMWEREVAIGGVGAVKATRRTEEENMPCERDVERLFVGAGGGEK